jgi:hypothetical protein
MERYEFKTNNPSVFNIGDSIEKDGQNWRVVAVGPHPDRAVWIVVCEPQVEGE